jgi:linoleoyl-CoA desaturase
MKSAEVQFASPEGVLFIQDLKNRAHAYLQSQHSNRWSDWRFRTKTGLLIIGATLMYCTALLTTTQLQFSMLYILFICASMLLVINVLHDAAHLAVFRTPVFNRWLNRFIALPLGLDPDYWTARHVNHHHAYPNIEGLDLDIEANAFLRQTPFQPYYAHFRFQHLYWPLIAALSLPYINWIFDWNDRLGKSPVASNKVLEGVNGWLIFLCAKVAHFVITLALPMLLLQHLSAWFILSIYIAAQLIASFVVVALILGTHWAEVEFFLPPASGKFTHTWIEHSFRTAVDWELRPSWLNVIFGGLNFHLTHHVFPTVNHRHYPALSKLVERTAIEHGWNYRKIDYPTLLKLQQQFLKRMGEAPASY